MVSSRWGRGLARALAALALAVAAAAEGAAAEPPPPAPPAPQWVSAVSVGGKVLLTWIRSPAHAAVRVYRSVRGSADPPVRVGESATNQFTDPTVAPGTAYLYRLGGVDASGRESRLSAEAAVAVPSGQRRPASAPRWEGALTVAEGIGLKWSSAGDQDVLAVNVYRKDPGDRDYRLVGSSRGTNYLDGEVLPGRSYVYALTAIDSSFRETPRSEDLAIVFTPPAPEPAPARGPPWAVRRTRLVALVTTAADVPLFRPSDVAVGPRTGSVYLADAGNNRVVVLDSSGEFQRVVGGDAGSQVSFQRLLGIAVDGEENLLAVDAGAAAVLAVDASGRLLRRHDLAGKAAIGPTGIIDAAVGADGRLFVVDNYNRRVLRIEPGGALAAVGKPGGGPGELAAPTFCATDREGRLLLADALNGRVVVFDAAGSFERSFGRPGLGPGGFGRPKGVAVGAGGETWVADSWLNVVSVFDAGGVFLAALGDEEGKLLDLGSPNGIALGERGRIYVAERLANRLQIREVVGGP